MVENELKVMCLFADELTEKQQMGIKVMSIKKVISILGCTVMGNGDISLGTDILELFDSS